MGVRGILFLLVGAGIMVSCAHTSAPPAGKVAEEAWQPRRNPASEGALICTNNPTGEADYFHYVMDPDAVKKNVAIMTDYNFSQRENYVQFPIFIKNWKGNSIEATGAPLSALMGTSLQAHHRLVEKKTFKMQVSNGKGTIFDDVKGSPMTITSAQVSCFVSGPIMLE